MKRTLLPVLCALLAAVFYACNVPFSKLLLEGIPSTFLASFLYLGAGIGVGAMYAVHWKREAPSERLTRADFPYALGMILLDIAAPIFLMAGIHIGSASNASLLGNFEIVATTLTARFLLGFCLMLAGTVLVVLDTVTRRHAHPHTHTFAHTHDGTTHMHTITHTHAHTHVLEEGRHGHSHSLEELEGCLPRHA